MWALVAYRTIRRQDCSALLDKPAHKQRYYRSRKRKSLNVNAHKVHQSPEYSGPSHATRSGYETKSEAGCKARREAQRWCTRTWQGAFQTGDLSHSTPKSESLQLQRLLQLVNHTIKRARTTKLYANPTADASLFRTLNQTHKR